MDTIRTHRRSWNIYDIHNCSHLKFLQNVYSNIAIYVCTCGKCLHMTFVIIFHLLFIAKFPYCWTNKGLSFYYYYFLYLFLYIQGMAPVPHDPAKDKW